MDEFNINANKATNGDGCCSSQNGIHGFCNIKKKGEEISIERNFKKQNQYGKEIC